MSFSEFGKYMRGSWSTFLNADAPVDAIASRYIVNNAQHIYDESGQALVNMTMRFGSNIDLAVTAGSYVPLMVFGPFPIRLRPNSGAYRIRMRGELGRTGAVAVDFRAGVTPTYAAALALSSSSATGPNIWNASVNTAQAQFTPSSDSMVWLADADVPNAYQPTSALDSSNNVVSTTWPQCYISIHGRSASGSQNLRIFSFYACEFMGQ